LSVYKTNYPWVKHPMEKIAGREEDGVGSAAVVSSADILCPTSLLAAAGSSTHLLQAQ
jgi:hypothetical protein